MTELDLLLWVSFALGIAAGFAAGYVVCLRRQLAIREQMLADARMVAKFNDRLYRNALAGRYSDQSGPMPWMCGDGATDALYRKGLGW